MAINKQLDVTPPRTLSTMQTSSVTFNLVIIATLLVLILVCIQTAISKLVYFTREANFRYKSWLRAYIFANSDDPLRILAWIMRRYAFRDRKWKRGNNQLRLSRLIIPLAARTFILLSSIAFVAIVIPEEWNLDPCENGDFGLTWNASQGIYSTSIASTCIDIPLTSDIGVVRTAASYCRQRTVEYGDSSINDTRFTVAKSASTGSIRFSIGNEDDIVGYEMYVEWRDLREEKDVRYRSDVESLDLEAYSNIAKSAILFTERSCQEPAIVNSTLSDSSKLVFDIECDMDVVQVNEVAESYIRTSLAFKSVDSTQPRIKIQENRPPMRQDDCVVDVTQIRPLINIVPLTFSLVFGIVINLLLSSITSTRGHALDSGFHVVKEALAHDCSSNPLEQNLDRDEIMHVHLHKWQCASTGGGHIGFIAREGDMPVNEFVSNWVIGGCTQAKSGVGWAGWASAV